MPISHNNDTEAFFANVDRLFKLIQNVLAKGQTTAAEKYIVYLFETITRYYIKESKVAQVSPEFFDFSVATSNIEIESSVATSESSLLGNYHKLKNYRNEFQDDITRLIYSQIKPSNFGTFYFIFNLLKDATGTLLNNPQTVKGGKQLLFAFKFISQFILFSQQNIPPSERNAYRHQTYDWFLDLLSVSIKDEDAMLVLSAEMREVLRGYIDGDEIQLFDAFLNSLSSRFFSFTLYDDRILEKYSSGVDDIFEYRAVIEKYKRRLRNITSVKNYRQIIRDFELEVNNKENWSIDKWEFKRNIEDILFNIFKLSYCQIIIVDAICYAIFKEKFSFFIRYLNYHEPEDADAHWINDNYSIQRFEQIIPFLVDYDRLMPETFMWVERHGIETYLNTFLGYYILTADINRIEEYVNTIQDTGTINTVLYNFRKIGERNVLRKLPDKFQLDRNTIDDKLKRILDAATRRREVLDKEEVQSAPIDHEARDGFFSNFFQSFKSQAIARSIYEHFRSMVDKEEVGENIGVNQRFPRKAFIKQSGSMFLSPHSQLATILADDETTHIFSIIVKNCQRRQMSRNEFEEYVKSLSSKFDLLISVNTYNIKANFPNVNFEESWSLENPLKQLPGYLGKLNGTLDVFWLGQRLPSKMFLLLNSRNLGQLINCLPPSLSGEYSKRKDQFAYSFIDFANDETNRRKLMDKGLSEEDLRTEVWIRIFESIILKLPEGFEAVNVEIIT